jgi:tetratricopeptide (TPR) repeat protein
MGSARSQRISQDTFMNESNLLAKVVTGPAIRRLAGDRYYQRGLDYFTRGRVASIEVWENTIEAVVSGTEEYAVELTARSGSLDFQCACPLGEDGEFCKHCVATALAWLSLQEAPPRPGRGGGAARGKALQITTPRITTKDIAKILHSEDKATLVELVLKWAREEPGLQAKLLRHAALAIGPEAAVHQARLALKKAISIRGYVSYYEAGGYAGAVGSAIDRVEELLRSGYSAPPIDLCEEGLRWLVEATGHIDDSDGQMTELMERLGDVHLRACETARPDPIELAGRLFRGELAAEYGEFHDSAQRYAEILGAPGVQAFRELAEAEWARVTARASEERGSHYAIASIMTSLARQSGDVEQLVAVLEHDLSSAYRYLSIAEAYREAGKDDTALEWVEKGIAAFPHRTDSRLRLFAAQEYQRRGRHQDALRIVWLDFLDCPGLGAYRLLEDFARKDDDWEEWRGRALRHIERALESMPVPKRSNGTAIPRTVLGRDRSLLVEIYLYEDKLEDAWRRVLRCPVAEAGPGPGDNRAGGVHPYLPAPGRGRHRECFGPPLRRRREAVGTCCPAQAGAWPGP